MRAAIEVANLRREFRVHAGLLAREKRVIAVDDVTFSVPAGGVLGIVGESGCGKSTLARLILGLMLPTSGAALVEGKALPELDRRARARLIQPVFQDPFASLNPRMTAGHHRMIIPPYCAPPDQAAVQRYFRALARKVGLPIVLYIPRSAPI